jgi:hypothetical protein
MRRWLEIGPPSQSDGDRPPKRDDHKAEVEPGPISLSVLRKHENMDYEPHTRREPQSKPNQIFGGLMCRPNCFALGTAYTCNDDDERPARCNGSAALSAQQCRLARQARARCEQAVRMTEPTALIAANALAPNPRGVRTCSRAAAFPPWPAGRASGPQGRAFPGLGRANPAGGRWSAYLKHRTASGREV